MRLILIALFVFVFLLVQTVPAAAAKPKKTAAPAISLSGKYVKAKNVVLASFGNLRGVKSVSYTLSYQANGVGQGVVENFSPGKKTSFSKNLYLGSCSGKVCVQHKNIKNIMLEAKVKFTNGKSSTKTVKVK